MRVPNTKSWKFLFLKIQKQGDSGAQPALYLFQSLYNISYTLKLIAVLSFWARANAMPLTSLIVHHYGSFTYTIITPRSSMWWHKALHLLERKEEKETYERHTCQFVSKKRGRNERCLITTEDLHFHYTCTWPEWYTFSLPWDITIAPAKWMCKTCVTFTQAPHTPSEESRKQSEVWVRWVNEWSEQESPPWFYKIKKNLPSTAKQELATTLMDSFRRSMGKDDSISHPESKVWRESFEITLVHTLSHEP